MNTKITERALARPEGKLDDDVVSLTLRTMSTLGSDEFEQLEQWGGKLLYDSGIVAVVRIPAGHVVGLAAWDIVLEIL